MRNRHMHQEKVVSRIGRGSICGLVELHELFDVPLALLLTVEGQGLLVETEKPRQPRRENRHRVEQTQSDSAIRAEAFDRRMIHPEAGVEHGGKDAAVRIEPAYDRTSITQSVRIRKDRVVLVEETPPTRVMDDEPSVRRRSNTVHCIPGHQRGQHDVGIKSGGLNVSEDCGLTANPIERRKLKIRKTTLVELPIAELVKNDPEDTSMRSDVRRADNSFDNRRVIEVPRLHAEPCCLKQSESAHDTRGNKHRHTELL